MPRPNLRQEIARLNSELANSRSELQSKEQELEVMNKRLQELTITDPLTGLFNRNYFNLQAPLVIARAKRNKTSICVAACTISQADENLLENLAHCLRTEAREGQDTTYRLSGHEFLVVMEQSDESAGLALLERVRARFSHISSSTNLTYGIASVSWKDLGSTLDDLIKVAAEKIQL